MPKPDIHPTWYPEAKVICNGKVVMTVGSTQPEIHVDVWSGNHPFYTGTQKIVDTEGRVDRFLRKYGMLDTVMRILKRKNSFLIKFIDPVVSLMAAGLFVFGYLSHVYPASCSGQRRRERHKEF